MLKNVIYYFSGTGNSLRVARKIATLVDETTLVSMRVDPKDYPATDAEKVGFVFPCLLLDASLSCSPFY